MKNPTTLIPADYARYTLFNALVADLNRRLALAQENHDVHLKTPERTNLIASYEGQIHILSELLSSYKTQLFHILAEAKDYD